MAVLLTKKSMAKRVYATVLNAGNNTDGYKEQGNIQSAISFKAAKDQLIARDPSGHFLLVYFSPSPFPQCLVAHLCLASVSKCNAVTEWVK